MSKDQPSVKGDRVVGALDRFAADLASGAPIEVRYTVRKVRVIPEPSPYPPARVRAVRELLGASQDVFAQLLAVSPMTVRSWEQGVRRPSPMARRFLDEIEKSPGHFRRRLRAALVETGPSSRTRGPGSRAKNDPGRGH